MRLDSTCKDYLIGEPPDREEKDWFLRRMAAIMLKTKTGRTYRVRHKQYLIGTENESKSGMTRTDSMTLIGKYPAGGLFRTEQGWNEFFTWQELAAGGLTK